MKRLLGAVLAGGESRRFGTDKALAMLGERALIDHAIAALAPQVDGIVVVGRVEVPSGITAVPDRPAPGLGPLAGLNAALHHARDNGFDAVVTVGCDTPVLPHDLVARLGAGDGPRFAATMPIIGYWPSSLADRLDAHLASGTERSVRGWAKVTRATSLEDLPELPNVNTPGDLAALRDTARH